MSCCVQKISMASHSSRELGLLLEEAVEGAVDSKAGVRMRTARRHAGDLGDHIHQRLGSQLTSKAVWYFSPWATHLKQQQPEYIKIQKNAIRWLLKMT